MKENLKIKIAVAAVSLLLLTSIGLGIGIGVCYANAPNSNKNKSLLSSNRAEIERLFEGVHFASEAYLEENGFTESCNLQLYSGGKREGLTIYNVNYASVSLKKQNETVITYTIYPEYNNTRKSGAIEYQNIDSTDVEWIRFEDGGNSLYAAYFYKKYLIEAIASSKDDLTALIRAMA